MYHDFFPRANSPIIQLDTSGEHVDLTCFDFDDPFDQPDNPVNVATPVRSTETFGPPSAQSSGGFASTGPFNVPPPSYDEVVTGTNIIFF